jgi:hypothetical protein
LDVAAEAAAAVAAAVKVRRPKPEQTPLLALPQLVGSSPLDRTFVPPLSKDRPLTVLELFSGVGSATQALVRLGYQVGEVVACEARGAARQAHAHALKELRAEFPASVAAKAGAQLHHRLPQDIRLVNAAHLSDIGPVDVVVAGWPCQGNSAAGKGRGLDDHRTGLFTELMRVLSEMQRLHKEWGHPLGYILEHVAAGLDKRPKVREHFAAVRGLLGPQLVMGAAQVGSRAHRLRAWWTNLEGTPLLRAAMANQTRPPGLFVHQVLGRGRRAKTPLSAGVAPWARVETPGQPRRALNTFVSYGGSYAFSWGGGGVLACTQPGGQVTFEEPSAEERELAMGFSRGVTAAVGLSEATRRELLGQAMDLNSLMWVVAASQAGACRRVHHSAAGGDGPEAQTLQSLAALRAAGASGVRKGQGAGGARGLSRVSLSPRMGARDTSAEGSGAQPGAGGTGREDSLGAPGTGSRAAMNREQPRGILEGHVLNRGAPEQKGQAGAGGALEKREPCAGLEHARATRGATPEGLGAAPMVKGERDKQVGPIRWRRRVG